MTTRKNIVVLTGAGISAESGIQTFRDSNGLWENHKIHDVATPEGWRHNPELVLRFYNMRRAAARKAQPNAAHLALAELEKHHNVVILTQNVDDLHERAGSTHVLHLHGELNKVRSVRDASYIIEAEGDVNLGDLCPKGGQLRPHIVWFGEDVPLMPVASAIAAHADIFLVVGTSLVVYPAAGLVDYAPEEAFIYVVDPSKPTVSVDEDRVIFIQKTATEGVPPLVQEWIAG